MHGDAAAHVEHRDHPHAEAPRHLPARAATLLVIEYASGGGLAGRPLEGPLVREGLAMRDALLADLTRLEGIRALVTVDARLPSPPADHVRAVPVGPGGLEAAATELAADAGRVWLIAPESGGRLAELAERVEAAGARLVGPDAAAIRAAADKLALARRLTGAGVAVPRTWPAEEAEEAMRAAGFPLVVKPSPGAACEGTARVGDRRRLRAAIRAARRCGGEALVQAYAAGRPASVSLLVGGGRAVPLALGGQEIAAGRRFAYRGGVIPLRHPHAAAAREAARRVCEGLPGLRGFVGVDLVLAPAGPVVIEVNPRLTTSYVGLRAALEANLAELALRAADGALPERPPAPVRTVRFQPDGRVQPA